MDYEHAKHEESGVFFELKLFKDVQVENFWRSRIILNFWYNKCFAELSEFEISDFHVLLTPY